MTLDIFEKFGLLPAISFLIGILLFIIAILWLIRYLKIFYIQIKPYFQFIKDKKELRRIEKESAESVTKLIEMSK